MVKRRVPTRTVIPDESMVLVDKPKEPLDLMCWVCSVKFKKKMRFGFRISERTTFTRAWRLQGR